LDFQDTLPHKESERNIIGWTCHEIQAFTEHSPCTPKQTKSCCHSPHN